MIKPLADENGQERLVRVEDEWLYENGIDEGSSWPSDGDHAYSCHMADRLQII